MLQEYKNNYQKCIAWQLDFKVSVICGYVMLQHMTWYGQYDRVFVYGSADYTNKQTIYLNNTAEGYNSRGLICIYWESVVIFQSEHLPVCSIMTFTKYWFKMNVIYCKLQCNFHSKFPYQLKLMSVKSIFVCGHDYAVRLNTLNMLLLQKKNKCYSLFESFTDSNHSLSFCTTVFLSDIEYAKNYAKMAESAKTLASQQVTEEPFYINDVDAIKLLL